MLAMDRRWKSHEKISNPNPRDLGKGTHVHIPSIIVMPLSCVFSVQYGRYRRYMYVWRLAVAH